MRGMSYERRAGECLPLAGYGKSDSMCGTCQRTRGWAPLDHTLTLVDEITHSYPSLTGQRSEEELSAQSLVESRDHPVPRRDLGTRPAALGPWQAEPAADVAFGSRPITAREDHDSLEQFRRSRARSSLARSFAAPPRSTRLGLCEHARTGDVGAKEPRHRPQCVRSVAVRPGHAGCFGQVLSS